MCYLRVFGCFQQRFPEGIIKSYEGTILTSGKVCCVQYLLVFRLSSGYTGERLIPGLRQKDWVLRALLLTVTSLWPQSGEIYSARWKLILISDQFKDLVKNCFEDGGLHVSFSTSGLHPGSWINRLFESRKVSCDDLCGESERFSVGVIWRCLARVKCGNIMSGFRKCCDFREIYCVITAVVDSYMVEKTLCQAWKRLSGFANSWLKKFQVHFNNLASKSNGKQLKAANWGLIMTTLLLATDGKLLLQK